MLRASHVNVSKIKYVAQTLAKVGDEALVLAGADGLVFKVLSPDKLILAVFRMPLSSFEEYHLDEEYKFTVRTDRVSTAMKRGTRNDILEIEYDPEPSVLRLIFRDKKTGVPRVFEIQTMPGLTDIPEPKVNLTSKILMGADDFKHMLSDAKAIGANVVTFETELDKLKAYASEEPFEYKGIFARDSPLIDIESPGGDKASYLLAALQAAAKPASAAEQLVLEFSDNMPMKLVYRFPGGEDLYLWIAPAIE